MTQSVKELVHQFEALPEREREEVSAELLRRAKSEPHDLPNDQDLPRGGRPPLPGPRPSRARSVTPRRGEVWLVDLGMAAKVRPALVISVEASDSDRRTGHTRTPHDQRARHSIRGCRVGRVLEGGRIRRAESHHHSAREVAPVARQAQSAAVGRGRDSSSSLVGSWQLRGPNQQLEPTARTRQKARLRRGSAASR